VASSWKAYGRYGTVGLELVLSIAIAAIIGHYLDGKFFPGKLYLTIAFAIGGTYAGFRQLYKAAKRLERDTEKMDREEAKRRKEKLDLLTARRRLEEVEREIAREQKRE